MNLVVMCLGLCESLHLKPNVTLSLIRPQHENVNMGPMSMSVVILNLMDQKVEVDDVGLEVDDLDLVGDEMRRTKLGRT